MYEFSMKSTTVMIISDIEDMMKEVNFGNEAFKQDLMDDLCDIVVNRLKDAFIKEMRVDRFNADEVAGDIADQHRTHQASIIRNLLDIVASYHVQETGSDLRNQAAVEVSAMIDAGDYHRKIPYI